MKKKTVSRRRYKALYSSSLYKNEIETLHATYLKFDWVRTYWLVTRMKYYLSGCRHIIYLVIFMLWPLDNEVAANKRCHFPAKKIRFAMQFRTCIHVNKKQFNDTKRHILCQYKFSFY